MGYCFFAGIWIPAFKFPSMNSIACLAATSFQGSVQRSFWYNQWQIPPAINIPYQVTNEIDGIDLDSLQSSLKSFHGQISASVELLSVLRPWGKTNSAPIAVLVVSWHSVSWSSAHLLVVGSVTVKLPDAQWLVGFLEDGKAVLEIPLFRRE